MFKYKAYEPGKKISYPVSQIRWDGVEKHVAFNGKWYKEEECFICAGTDMKDSDGNEIFEGDILQLGIYDSSCYLKGKIGIVSFFEGRFSWSTFGGWQRYSLAGKNWKNLGNKAYLTDDLKCQINEQAHKNSYYNKMFEEISKNSNGVIFEKYKNVKNINLTFKNTIVESAEKKRKTILHQYKNYLKIKNMIESKEICPEIMNSNLV